MSTTRHQEVGKCNSLEMCEFTGGKTFGRDPNSCVFFHVIWLFWGCRSRAPVSAGSGLDLGKLVTKSAQDCGESSTCTSKQLWRPEHFWKMRAAKCARDYSEARFQSYVTDCKKSLLQGTSRRKHTLAVVDTGRMKRGE
jgi:hypothetical protein